jgi:toxin-antitoxin system PIN domain toxin
VIAIDTNVLVYAHREEMPAHARAKGHLLRLAQGATPWALPVFCLGEFVRVVTHPRIFTPPSALTVALQFLDALLRCPSVRLLTADADYGRAYIEVSEKARASGNVAFDAQIAAVCLVHGATLLTADRDFYRFGIETEAFGE